MDEAYIKEHYLFYIDILQRPLCMLKDVGAYRAIFNISLILPFVIALFFSPYG